MKLNIFSIDGTEIEQLKARLRDSGMQVIKEVHQAGWHGSFYYSMKPFPSSIPWVATYEGYFEGMEIPKNCNYYATFLFEKGQVAYALSYGKAHFYLRPFCDYDFGVDLAKRIAKETDVKQTASKRFQGKKKKEIKSYTSNSRLAVESGESIDYLQGSVVDSQQATFGKSGKFGTSALLSPEIAPSDLGKFLDQLVAAMAQDAQFKLPRTTIVTDPFEVAKYDKLLTQELHSDVGATDFAQNSYDLYGVDFVFSSDGSFKLRCPGYPEVERQELTMKDLKTYIDDCKITGEDVLKIKIVYCQEDRPNYTQPIKHAIDYIVDSERVLLSGGRWMRFNQDYLEFLDEYLREIRVEETEPEFADIWKGEPTFNISEEVAAAGYRVADKDFNIFKTRSSTPIEAWDLSKDNTVYAVKFGTPQKLGYVCDQATTVLELLRNKAEVKKVPHFERYCLWFGYRSKQPLGDITASGSIIFKQKIETWARKATELGIEPVIKISRKMREGVDVA